MQAWQVGTGFGKLHRKADLFKKWILNVEYEIVEYWMKYEIVEYWKREAETNGSMWYYIPHTIDSYINSVILQPLLFISVCAYKVVT